MFDVFGAMPLPSGVNFTIHTHGGTSCELLLFRKGEEEPYAVLPFPEEYKIGDVYSMMVFGLEVEDFGPSLKRAAEDPDPNSMYLFISPFFGKDCVRNYEELQRMHPSSMWILPVVLSDLSDPDFKGGQLADTLPNVFLWKVD